ncbi:MAG: copper-translocating P-type ATPase [Bacteroidia bacterium]|jgi:Cu2+-exporting ATPase|nr:copper-translocating P-type ATPase [Bacteroidia bacterium]
MSCASCALSVETILSAQDGVKSCAVNFADNSVVIEFDSSQTKDIDLKKSVQDAGYDLILNIKNNSEESNQLHEASLNRIRQNTIWSGVFAIPIMVIGMFFMDMSYGNYIMWVLATPVLLVWGRSFYINAWHQLKIKKANMDSLVALSTGIAYIFSVFNTLNPQYWHSRGLHPHVYFEASVVIIFFILLGKWLEEKAKSNTSNAIKKLIGLQPKTVSLLQHDNTTIQVPIDQIKKEDVIVVKPGDKIPVDGVVVSGESFVDESSINGEPIPVLKNINTKVFTGTINQKGTINISAQKVGDETLLAQIIKMVQEAQGSKAPIQKNVDKIASVFVPTVMMIAVVTFIVWMVSGIENSFTYGLLSAITVLVIACPCALGLATPTAIMVGIGKGAQLGILIKDAEALELSKNINAIILDKTGTITEGKPKVESLVWNKQLSNIKELSQILFSIESKSEHPLAQSVCDYLKQTDAIVIDGFENITGKGVKAHINGVSYFVGSMSFMNDLKLTLSDDLQKEFNDYSEQAYTVFAFSNQQEVLALIAITDKIKETSIQAIKGLQEMGIEVYMLTGDSEAAAKNVASKTGIKLYKSSVMPQDKAAFTKELQSKGKVVAMVGDGINDSNALAQADVSFAMAKGSDIAMDVAKVTIMSSDLMQLLKAIQLSRLTVSKIRQNLFWAFIYNVIGIPLAAGILFPVNGFLLNPMIAGGAMALSSVSVVTNSLLLKFKKI